MQAPLYSSGTRQILLFRTCMLIAQVISHRKITNDAPADRPSKKTSSQRFVREIVVEKRGGCDVRARFQSFRAVALCQEIGRPNLEGRIESEAAAQAFLSPICFNCVGGGRNEKGPQLFLRPTGISPARWNPGSGCTCTPSRPSRSPPDCFSGERKRALIGALRSAPLRSLLKASPVRVSSLGEERGEFPRIENVLRSLRGRRGREEEALNLSFLSRAMRPLSHRLEIYTSIPFYRSHFPENPKVINSSSHFLPTPRSHSLLLPPTRDPLEVGASQAFPLSISRLFSYALVRQEGIHPRHCRPRTILSFSRRRRRFLLLKRGESPFPSRVKRVAFCPMTNNDSLFPLFTCGQRESERGVVYR